MKIYGELVQNGTPTPNKPVKIEERLYTIIEGEKYYIKKLELDKDINFIEYKKEMLE